MFSSGAQNRVSGLKDKNENLWFTVEGRGVYRYDGKYFINFTKENYGSNINISSCIYEDKAGNLWFNTTKGLCYYDGKKFTDFKIPMPAEGIINPEKYLILYRSPIKVWKMLQDKKNNFWFLTADHGVYRYNANLQDSVANEKSLAAGQIGFTSFLLDEAPNCILETKKGDIYIGSWSQGGVYRYEGTSFTKLPGFSDTMIACMLEDKTGNIWVGTRNFGVDLYDPLSTLKAGRVSVTNFSTKDGLTDNCIYCLLEDSKGNIWLGSDAGQKFTRGDAFYYNGKSFTNITAKLGLALVDGFVYAVNSIIEDNAGNIWIGSKNGLLLCYDGKKFIDFSEHVAK